MKYVEYVECKTKLRIFESKRENNTNHESRKVTKGLQEYSLIYVLNLF